MYVEIYGLLLTKIGLHVTNMKLVIKKFRLQHSLQHLGNNVQSASIIDFDFDRPL